MSLYRADIASDFLGQNFLNSLWYRDENVLPIGIDPQTAAQELGERIRDQIILPHATEARWSHHLAKGTRISEVLVMRYSLANPLDWSPQFTAPVSTNVNHVVPGTAAEAYAPEVVAIIRLRCGIATLAPTDYTPRGGYLAYGPITQDSTLENGTLVENVFNALDNLGAALALTLDMGGGFRAVPIRVGRGRNSLGVTVPGFADVTSVSPRSKVSFRRSRSGA